MIARFFLFLFLSVLFTSPGVSQVMNVKQQLGYDFKNDIGQVLNYYHDIGVRIFEEERHQEQTPDRSQPLSIHYISFTNTPPFLSVETKYIHIGLINGRIEVIRILTEGVTSTERMDMHLHHHSRGKVDTSYEDGIPATRWTFDDCAIVKQYVALKSDSGMYYRYDIIPY